METGKESSDEAEDNRCSSHCVVYCLFLRTAVVFVYSPAYLIGLILKKLDVFLIYLIYYLTPPKKSIIRCEKKIKNTFPIKKAALVWIPRRWRTNGYCVFPPVGDKPPKAGIIFVFS
jgi:hypothetical protein